MEIREAKEADVDFIAWVMLTASRSHLPRGIWEYLYDHTEKECLAYLRRLALTSGEHWCHLNRFIIAEVDGERAAALSGYDPDVHGMQALGAAMPEVADAINFDEGFFQRAATVQAVGPINEPGAWVVEHVATRPEYRRQGLVDALLNEMLERGRGQGFKLSQIGVFLGNESARKAYLKAGYEFKDEKRNADFERDLGCAGIERLLRPL